MKPAALPAILTLVLCTTAVAQQAGLTDLPSNGPAGGHLARMRFTQDHFPGTGDANDCFMGGTEAMWLAGHGGRLFAAIGYGQDQPGDDPKPGAQILRKDAAVAMAGAPDMLRRVMVPSTPRWRKPTPVPLSHCGPTSNCFASKTTSSSSPSCPRPSTVLARNWRRRRRLSTGWLPTRYPVS